MINVMEKLNEKQISKKVMLITSDKKDFANNMIYELRTQDERTSQL